MSINNSRTQESLNTKLLSTLKTLYKRSDIRAILFLLVLMVLIESLTPNFLSGQNTRFILLHSTVLCLIALGETLVVLMGMIDLSPAAIASFAGIVIGSRIYPTTPPFDIFLQILLVLLLGLALGLMNGGLIVFLRIPSIIATLSTMILIQGFTLLYSGGFATGVGMPASFAFLGQGKIGTIPTPVIIMLLTVLIIQFVLSKTVFGRHIFAIGGNEEAAILSGINTNIIKIIVFGIAGLLSSLGGILLTAELNSAYPDAADNLLLPAIAAVVLGGTKLMGSAGEGSAYQTLIGAVILAVISNALVILGINAYYQNVVTGIILLAATARAVKEKIIK